MELVRGGEDRDYSDEDVDEMMRLSNEIIRFVNQQKYPAPIWRVRTMALVLGRIMGSTANNRAALMRDINEHLEMARDGAIIHMKQREEGVTQPPPIA